MILIKGDLIKSYISLRARQDYLSQDSFLNIKLVIITNLVKK